MIENIELALQILLLGWGGIFIVMLVIYIVSLLLGKLFPPANDEC